MVDQSCRGIIEKIRGKVGVKRNKRWNFTGAKDTKKENSRKKADRRNEEKRKGKKKRRRNDDSI